MSQPTMQYRLLGRSGLRVSSLCLGTAFFGITPLEDGVDALVGRALDLGITFFDTANSYGNQTRFDRPGIPPAAERKSSEELLGRALRGRSRYDVIVATKVQEKMGEGPNDGGPAGGGLTRKHIVAQCEQSLRRLQTDYIDVYYAHHPDPTTPLDQTLRAFDDLVEQGKVRYPALSNYASWQLTRALWLCERDGLEPPVAMEMPYSLLTRWIEREVVPACLAFEVGITAYSPLAGGLLTGVYRRGEPLPPGSRASFQRRPLPPFSEAQLQLAEELSTLAAGWGHSPAQVALAWLLSRPALASAIVGPETVAQLEELVPAADLQHTPEQLEQVGALTPGFTPPR
jgi:aryl-alcohol dehydrogenase-like predicted oxidoreductase